MLKDITGIKLAGGGFINPVELRLFDPLDGNKVKLPKGTILYGRNGSGKSTIAKAIKKVVKGGYPHITQATVLDKDGNIIPTDSRRVKYTVSGSGTFEATANGDPTSLMPFQNPEMDLFSGASTAIVRSSKESGDLTFTATAKGVKPATITIKVK